MNILEYENKFLTKCLDEELQRGTQQMRLVRSEAMLVGWLLGMMVGIITGILIGWGI